MVATAEWHGEFVADFDPKGSRLRKAQVMGIGRMASTDETRLGDDKVQMRFIPATFGFGSSEGILVDLVGGRGPAVPEQAMEMHVRSLSRSGFRGSARSEWKIDDGHSNVTAVELAWSSG